MKDTFDKSAESVLAGIIKFRRELHKHPELGFCECDTAEIIGKMLGDNGIEYKRIAGTGVIVRMDGKVPRPEKPVVLRADIDGLPVKEATGLDFASVNDGVMHACGHDIHTACLMGALLVMNANKDKFDGTILAIFQPGEERHPGGASLILKEGVFDGMEPVAFIGQHVAPEIEAGKFGFKSGVYMASSDEIYITVQGSGGHGGLPQTLTDPVYASAQMIVALQQIVSRNADPNIQTVLSIGQVLAEGANNVIPPVVKMAGTLRTMNDSWRANAKERIKEIVNGIAAACGVAVEVEYLDGYPVLANDPFVTEETRKVCEEFVGEENVLSLQPRMTAEDFAFYAQRYPSVFYRLGVGRPGKPFSGLHTPTFDADEDSIIYGIRMLVKSTRHFLKK